MQFPAIVFFFASVLSLRDSSAWFEESEVRKLLPSSTLIYVEAQSLSSILEHPFAKAVQDSAAFKKVLRAPDVVKLRGGIALLEFALGEKAESLLGSLTANGVHLAYDKATDGLVLLACSESREWLDDYLQKLVKLARTDANLKNQGDPIREAEYRGIHGYEFNKVIVGAIGSILLVTNKPDLGKNVIDRYLDSTEDHLHSNSQFQEAWTQSDSPSEKAASQTRIAELYVDLNAMRQAGIAKELLKGTARDFAGEVILGGVLAAIQKTSYMTSHLCLAESRLLLQAQVPYRKEWNAESREFFVGPGNAGLALPLVDNSASMASLIAYRNLSELWLRAGDLFDQKVNDELAQADNTLTTLFSGKDFGSDILGAIEPQVQLIVFEQSFGTENIPAIQIPSFGLVAKLKNSAMKLELKRIFQSFVGFLNVAGAMEGKPQLDLDSETVGVRQIYTASFIQESDKKYPNGLPIQFNFSPSLAFEGDLVVMASTHSLAKSLVVQSANQNLANESANTSLTVNMPSVKNALEANRLQLVSQNMLEKGHSKSQAEKEVESLLSILSLFERGSASLRFDDRVHVELDLEIRSGL